MLPLSLSTSRGRLVAGTIIPTTAIHCLRLVLLVLHLTRFRGTLGLFGERSLQTTKGRWTPSNGVPLSFLLRMNSFAPLFFSFFSFYFRLIFTDSNLSILSLKFSNNSRANWSSINFQISIRFTRTRTKRFRNSHIQGAWSLNERANVRENLHEISGKKIGSWSSVLSGREMKETACI